MVDASNDSLADDIADIVRRRKIGTDACAMLLTKKLSDGRQWVVLPLETYERDLRNREIRERHRILALLRHEAGERGSDAISEVVRAIEGER